MKQLCIKYCEILLFITTFAMHTSLDAKKNGSEEDNAPQFQLKNNSSHPINFRFLQEVIEKEDKFHGTVAKNAVGINSFTVKPNQSMQNIPYFLFCICSID